MRWLSLIQSTSVFVTFVKTKNAVSLFLGLFALLTLCSGNVIAKEPPVNAKFTHNMANSAIITEPWARATFALAKTGAAYFSIKNTRNVMLIIESVSISQNVAMQAEIHHTIMHDDMMQMQELTEGVKIKSGEKVDFSPGGKHVMLMGLKGPLNKGESIVISLHFKDGSYIEQTFPIVDKRN